MTCHGSSDGGGSICSSGCGNRDGGNSIVAMVVVV